MAYHIFNIGKPYTNAWWNEVRSRGVITAGYDAAPNDRGDVILHDMTEGDWVIAYCNGHGYVGAGVVSPIDTYFLHGEAVSGSLSNHRHERGVTWLHAVDDITNAVPLSAVQKTAPRQAKERERDEAKATKIIQMLAKQNSAREPSKYWYVLDAVRALGGPSSVADIQRWLDEHHPAKSSSDARENITLLTVNDANRRHYDRTRTDFRSDTGHPKDVLFKSCLGRRVFFDVYRPAEHGIWDIVGANGAGYRAVRVRASDADVALAEARRLVTDDQVAGIESDEDSRIRELRAVVVREGQGEFRAGLLNAYENQCAMTGCAVIEILEAAHIKPYLGAETNRTDNGLLLRADIHTLFDKGLLWVDEQLLIQISDRLHGSEYSVLSGKRLRLPSDPLVGPHPEHLEAHRRAALKR